MAASPADVYTEIVNVWFKNMLMFSLLMVLASASWSHNDLPQTVTDEEVHQAGWSNLQIAAYRAITGKSEYSNSDDLENKTLFIGFAFEINARADHERFCASYALKHLKRALKCT